MSAIDRFRHRVNLHRCEERFAALVDAFAWMPLCGLIEGSKTECDGAPSPASRQLSSAGAADPRRGTMDGRGVT